MRQLQKTQESLIETMKQHEATKSKYASRSLLNYGELLEVQNSQNVLLKALCEAVLATKTPQTTSQY